jgi:hypothetical protein
MVATSLLVAFNAGNAGAQAPGETEFLCASLYTGAVMYRATGCPAGYRAIDLTSGEVTLCRNLYTGAVSYRPSGVCASGYRPLVVGG